MRKTSQIQKLQGTYYVTRTLQHCMGAIVGHSLLIPQHFPKTKLDPSQFNQAQLSDDTHLLRKDTVEITFNIYGSDLLEK